MTTLLAPRAHPEPACVDYEGKKPRATAIFDHPKPLIWRLTLKDPMMDRYGQQDTQVA